MKWNNERDRPERVVAVQLTDGTVKIDCVAAYLNLRRLEDSSKSEGIESRHRRDILCRACTPSVHPDAIMLGDYVQLGKAVQGWVDELVGWAA